MGKEKLPAMPNRDKRSSGSRKKFTSSEDSELVNQGKRIPCECEASMHELINNCTSCGRIVCAKEGSGACFTCGSMVYTAKELENLIRRKKSEAKETKTLSFKSAIDVVFGGNGDYSEDPDRAEAIKQKNKLLSYAATSAKRTTLIDDENYQDPEGNKWLTYSEREKLKQRQEQLHDLRHGHKKAVPVTFDFANRTLIEEKGETVCPNILDEALDNDISIFKYKDYSSSVQRDYIPKFCEVYTPFEVTYDFETEAVDEKRSKHRIQDKELQFMSDQGMCLTVAQPYASLLVSGIKTSEGRNWSSCFRGRLWIHSKMIEIPPEEIDSVEACYYNITGTTEFPSSYPIGVLLGCVDIVDCLSQEQYREKYPNGECGSEYVFICENPREMKIQIPMSGKRKIYKLDPVIHHAAKNLLI